MPEQRRSQFQPALVSAEDPTFNLLVYGDPGAGKTTFAAGAQDHPAMRNVLFANKEGGMLSVAHRGDIHEVPIRTTEELTALGWELANGAWDSVRTLVIDNATEVQTVNLVQAEDRADIWVVKRGGELRFAFETDQIGGTVR